VEDPAAVDPAVAEKLSLREPGGGDAPDLDLYQIGNSPPHAYVYRAALARPGVVLLHDVSLHHLVLAETVERGDVSGYLREMRRAHGERGSFVGRQVARALGGELLPALFPLNDRVLESSLAVVSLTQSGARLAASRLPGRPVMHLPHHLALPLDPVPTRNEARAALALAEAALLVTAPGLATASKRLEVAIRCVARLPGVSALRLVVAGAADPRSWQHGALPDWGRALVTGRLGMGDFVRHRRQCRYRALLLSSHGEISSAGPRARRGATALVTAGTLAPGVPEAIVPVDRVRMRPELLALPRARWPTALRATMGELACRHLLGRRPAGHRRAAGALL
jgi:hypothetical protein